jgi:hypothetical protein
LAFEISPSAMQTKPGVAESVDVWTGYLDGAVRSGEHAAKEAG